MGLYCQCSENNHVEQSAQFLRSWPATLVSHMQKAGFLMTAHIIRKENSLTPINVVIKQNTNVCTTLAAA